MTDIEQTVAEIRRRDSMYPDVELTPGAVADRRTLLNIIDRLQDEYLDDVPIGALLKAVAKRGYDLKDLVRMYGDVRAALLLAQVQSEVAAVEAYHDVPQE